MRPVADIRFVAGEKVTTILTKVKLDTEHEGDKYQHALRCNLISISKIKKRAYENQAMAEYIISVNAARINCMCKAR